MPLCSPLPHPSRAEHAVTHPVVAHIVLCSLNDTRLRELRGSASCCTSLQLPDGFAMFLQQFGFLVLCCLRNQ